MAPQPPSRHSRAMRSAKDPRGLYAPPLEPVDPSPSFDTVDNGGAFDAAGAFANFHVGKKDKRSIRHQQLLARVKEGGVRKSRSSATAKKIVESGRVVKRRRPAKKLVGGGLGGLADALPDAGGTTTPEEDEDGGWEGVEETEGTGEDSGLSEVPEGLRKAKRVSAGVGSGKKIVMKSLRHRPGALKRKRKMEGLEMERFGRNLAEMVGSMHQAPQQKVAEKFADKAGPGMNSGKHEMGDKKAAAERERWAALRKFIGGTMEKSEGFLGKG